MTLPNCLSIFIRSTFKRDHVLKWIKSPYQKEISYSKDTSSGNSTLFIQTASGVYEKSVKELYMVQLKPFGRLQYLGIKIVDLRMKRTQDKRRMRSNNKLTVEITRQIVHLLGQLNLICRRKRRFRFIQ